MDNEKQLRKKIFAYIKEFAKERNVSKQLVRGKTRIPYAGRVYDEREMINLIDASLDFWLTEGRYAKEFERKLAEIVGVRYCALTNSGSSSNLLAVSALTSHLLKERRCKPGDEVITTACGFPTTLNPILQNGLVPVFVDIDLGTYNINVKAIEKAITKKTKAIFVAHTLGNPVDLKPILVLAKKYNLWLVEDNCDALGSEYNGKRTGSFGHISTCSFYPPHHITTGEGGAVLTSDKLLHKIIVSFRDWGRDCWCNTGEDDTCKKRFSRQYGDLPLGYDHKYVYSHIGYNLKMTDMQAAIGVAQIDKLAGFTKKRRQNFKILYDFFKKFEDYFILPETAVGSNPSWFGFPVLVKQNAPFSRANIVDYLEKNRIATRMLFGGNLTRQPAYMSMKFRKVGSLRKTDIVMNDLFWVGVYPGLSKDELGFIMETVEKFIEKNKIKRGK